MPNFVGSKLDKPNLITDNGVQYLTLAKGTSET